MKSNPAARHDEDFYAWAMQNAALMRAGRLSEIDREHIAEELESMGASERRELLSRLQVLIMHLLKHQYQPERRGKSWLLTIQHQRTEIERLLEQSPSLKGMLTEERINSVYRKAIKEAIIETGLDTYLFPSACEYSLAQLLNDEYLPE